MKRSTTRARTRSRNRDWYTTPSGADCMWCFGRDAEPCDPEAELCRGHLAEYEGMSIDGLDHMDSELAAEYADIYG